MKVLQLDSIPIVIRSQYLPFLSRLGPYAPSLLDRIAYEHDEWFEAWAHEASLLPVASEPLFRWMKQRAREGQTWRWLSEFASSEGDYVRAVLDEAKAKGTVSAATLSDPRPRSRSGGWGSGSAGARALEWLFRVGELGVRRTGNFEKRFSPLADIVPSAVLQAPTPTVEDAQRTLTQQAVEAVGVGTARDVADHFRLPIREVRTRLVELVESGAIDEVSVEGWKHPAFCDPNASVPRALEGATVLSPFDPVVWNRDRAERLFGFAYKIEIYVPAAKRQWGYYVLPVLVDGHLVARLDVKTDRAGGRLHVLASHAEPDWTSAETVSKVADAVTELAAFVGVDAVVVAHRGNLARALRPAVARSVG